MATNTFLFIQKLLMIETQNNLCTKITNGYETIWIENNTII